MESPVGRRRTLRPSSPRPAWGERRELERGREAVERICTSPECVISHRTWRERPDLSKLESVCECVRAILSTTMSITVSVNVFTQSNEEELTSP